MHRAHFALCLHRDRFILTQVRIFQLTHLRHILPYSVMMDFFSHELSFLNSHALDTFCLVPSSWWIFAYIGRVFPTRASSIICLPPPSQISTHTGQFFSTQVPCIYFVICLCHDGFFSRESSFSDLCASSIFCHVPPPW